MIVIDGSYGEGGGQVLRTSLTMSLVTGQPFRIDRIRAGRKKPGLLNQHLMAVDAAAEIGRAEVSGNDIGSQQLDFAPTGITPGRYRYAIGTAGSCTLVLQTVLPALIVADAASELILEGGTHNPFAPPFDYLAEVFLPLLNRMGPAVTARLDRYGFYPAGGGRIHITIEPCRRLKRLDMRERGNILARAARAVVARLPRHIGEREMTYVGRQPGFDRAHLQVEETQASPGPGNAVMVRIECERITELFTAFGKRGVTAETVAEAAVREAAEYESSGAPVGRHLADQLLIPMVLAGGGTFRTLPPTLHTTTNVHVLKQFLDVDVTVAPIADNLVEIQIRCAGTE